MSIDDNAAQEDITLDRLLAKIAERERTDHRYADDSPLDGVDIYQEGMRREDLRTLLSGRYSHEVEQSYSDEEIQFKKKGMQIDRKSVV